MNNSIEESQKKMRSVPSRHKRSHLDCGRLFRRLKSNKSTSAPNRTTANSNGNSEKYDMLLDVNDEICDTVMRAGEDEDMRLSGRVNLPPNSLTTA